ncbi:DNA polymerase III subunit delta [Heyndrickxia ginsengihumi]|uniref:DNA polymerase III subunit delta n=1 Tax=Heyndrickxia ginsengihumi TaxID=363870 RepID=A0A6M0P4T9_9BACI|nr:DNA polymerase III subunit delta [Heyndrickxia ginsengihumi]MBE6185072.1 DNA polymerase III subunit delta [Bacillus sp. (in: firmicutes)]MCM3021789.1 DNA polymerase III subunit delta [Heyndrickxia ginsengihumi]NEY19722.1 DNA polymerase III subunit delta [Heyndrickxia ginsengihumi]
MIDLWKKIERQQFSPLYLLYGKEDYLIQETKQKLINKVLTPEEMDFNYASYDLEETPIEVAVEDAETFPFMGEKRLVFVHNPYFLTTEKPKQKVDHHIEALEAYIQAPAPYTIFVLIGTYEKLDERKKITKLLKKHAEVGQANQLNDNDLKSWIVDRANEHGFRIGKEATEMLIELSGTNLNSLANEIDKLCLFATGEKEITLQMVEQLTARSLEQNIFKLVEKVVQRRIDEALRIYYDLLKQNEEPIKLLAVLANQFRLIYQTKELARRGYGQQQIASHLKVHPFRVKLAAGQAKLFSEEELNHIMFLLAESDYKMKTSGLRKEMIIEMFLFRINEKRRD